jgi:hypothetical protein
MNSNAARRSLQFNSTHLAILLTIIALAAGWILKTAVTNHTQAYLRAGVSASIPYQWEVINGLEGESLIFTANPPLDRNQHYEVSLLPVIPGGKVTDLVNTHNLSQGQALPF